MCKMTMFNMDSNIWHWRCVTWMSMCNSSQPRVRWRGFCKVLCGLLIFIKRKSCLKVLNMLVAKINSGRKWKSLQNICLETTTTEYSSGHLSHLDAFTREYMLFVMWDKKIYFHLIEILFGAAYCWILKRCIMISLPQKCLKFYENCEIEKAADRRWS